MPRKVYVPIKLPLEQPDRCELCPLIGKIPDEEREEGVREGYFCLGRYPFPRLKSKGIKLSKAEYRRKKRVLHRPCDKLWDVWTSLPKRCFCMPNKVYLRYRMEFEREQQLKYYPYLHFKK